jgi:hypothetical protein
MMIASLARKVCALLWDALALVGLAAVGSLAWFKLYLLRHPDPRFDPPSPDPATDEDHLT